MRVDVRDGKPFDNTVVGHYVYRVRWSRGRPRAAVPPHQPPPERDGAGRRRPGDRRMPRRSARGVADRLGDVRAADGLSRRRTPIHLGIAAQRLEQLLSLRSRRPADRAAHSSAQRFEAAALVKVDERAGAALLHRARRRQPPEAAAAPRRSRRQERPCGSPIRRSTTRSAAASAALGARPEQPAVDAAVRHLAGQPLLRRRLSDARHAAGDAARRRRERHDRRRRGEERHDAVRGARPEESGAVHLHRRRRQDDAARADSVSDDVRSGEEVPGAVSVYGAPEFASNTARESFVAPSALTEYGFLRRDRSIRARVPGLGKRTLDALYQKLGQAEIDDMAEGVKALWSRPYFDKSARRHLRHVVRRLHRADGTAPPSGGVRRRVRVVAGDRLAQLRHDLHRALHVDARRRTRTATTPAAR